MYVGTCSLHGFCRGRSGHTAELAVCLDNGNTSFNENTIKTRPEPLNPYYKVFDYSSWKASEMRSFLPIRDCYDDELFVKMKWFTIKKSTSLGARSSASANWHNVTDFDGTRLQPFENMAVMLNTNNHGEGGEHHPYKLLFPGTCLILLLFCSLPTYVVAFFLKQSH